MGPVGAGVRGNILMSAHAMIKSAQNAANTKTESTTGKERIGSAHTAINLVIWRITALTLLSNAHAMMMIKSAKHASSTRIRSTTGK